MKKGERKTPKEKKNQLPKNESESEKKLFRKDGRPIEPKSTKNCDRDKPLILSLFPQLSLSTENLL